MSDNKLPSFKTPPVVETVLGVQFNPLRGFTNAHLGAFWKRIVQSSCADSRWTKVTDAAPLAPSVEHFGEEHAWSAVGLTLRVSSDPPAGRLQIRNESGDALIQVQNDRLHFNWIRGQDGGYPRYESVRPKFDAVRAEFEAFLREEGFDGFEPNQWEVTYVNHIPRGTVWQTPRDWGALFAGLLGQRADPSEVRFESLTSAWHFEIPERRGRLHIDLKHAKTQEDPRTELLRLTLTARGPVSSAEGGESNLSDGLDLGRRVIVRTFRDITSEEAHAYWELEP